MAQQNLNHLNYNQEELREMLKELLELDSGLSAKEISFLDGLDTWIGRITDNQAAWLVKIYDRMLGI